MEQVTHQERAGQSTATATILNFKARDAQKIADNEARGAQLLKSGSGRPDLSRLNGILLGAILLPAVMAIMEIMRILFAD